jgi:hypothetical protein
VNSHPSDTVRQKIIVSLVHSVWWSFVVTFAGALLLCAVLGTPAFFFDLYQNFELRTYLLMMTFLALALLLFGTFAVHGARELSSISNDDNMHVSQRKRKPRAQ